MNIENLMKKLSEIENRVDRPVNEVISAAEQQELTKLFLQLSDPRYASNQDVARELDRYNSVMRDVDKYATSTFTPGSDQVGMPEVPRQPMPGEKPAPGGNKPLTGNQPAIMAMQKELKAAGADLGNFGSNKDGIDGNLGGPNSKTRQAMKKYPEIAKKHGFGLDSSGQPSGQSARPAPAPAPATAVPKDIRGKMMAIARAISGAGTDEEAVYAVLDSVKSAQEFNAIAAAYKQAHPYKVDMGVDLADDFSGIDLVYLNQRLAKFGVQLSSGGEMTPLKQPAKAAAPKAESMELDNIKFLSGIK